MTGAARRPGASLGDVRWRLVVPTALCVMVLAFLLARLFVYVWDDVALAVGGAGDTEGPFGDIDWTREFTGVYGLPGLHFLLTFLGAWWVARRAGEWRTHGLLVGALATFYGQIVMMILWPTTSLEQVLAGWGLLALPFPRAAGYLALGLAGGLLGGAVARTVLARREALVRASREIGAARVPAGVTAAVGRHLAGRKTIGVALWEADPRDGKTTGFGLLESWTPRDPGGWPADEEIDAARVPALAGLRDRGPLVAKVSGLPEAERKAWTGAGIRSMLLVPLVAPGEEETGLLTVASRRRWRAFPGGSVRRYATAGTQAALALENMRLVEEARRIGQEAGTLRERNRLAREIHDTLTQGFVSIVMNLEASEEDGRSDADRRRRENIERTARESLSEARRLVKALGPGRLEGVTLAGALEDLARLFSEETGIRAEAVVDGEPLRLPPESEAALLRAAQEALHNVRKHAGAGRVMISLSYMGDRAVLDVRDDGAGFEHARTNGEPADGRSGGFGLDGMRGRIEERGGVLHVESTPGEGTTLTAEMPLVEASGPRHQASGERA